MSDERWLDVVARIVPGDSLDLDEALFGRDTPEPGPVSARGKVASTAPSAKLWERQETTSHIGIRVDRPAPEVPHLAFKLASIAAERSVVPVILSPLARTGFERYGFRVERLPPGPPEEVARCEEEIRRFWDMPIVIDLEDVEALG